MEINRKPFQGVGNIIRFNWHFYVLAVGTVMLLLLLAQQIGTVFQPFVYILCFLIVSCIAVSLLASFYVYDLSDLYNLNWMDKKDSDQVIINIHSGFDETSTLLIQAFPEASLSVFDFYDPIKHTEVSIKRAREAYPPFPGTQSISTDYIPLTDASVDTIVVALSAHEIRDAAERIRFFKELFRILKPGGNIYITEHLRDVPNFLAYNIGFFHFHSKNTWLQTFKQSGLQVIQEIKTTPFISTFILTRYGNSI
jgi:SAM-dependent methyltransferase